MFKRVIFIFIISWGVLSNTYAQQICPLPQNIKPKGVSSLDSFKRITVLGDERISTVDSFARNMLIRFSGKASLDEKSAVDWFTKLLFASESTRKDKVFRINNEVLMILEISSEQKGLYSYAEIEPSLQKLTNLAEVSSEIEEHNRNAINNDILSLYQNIALYTNLANSFAFAIPSTDFQVNNEDVARLLNLPNGKNLYSFFDIASKAETIMSATESVDQKAIEERTPQEEESLRLLGNLFRWSMYYENNAFRIIPSFDPRDNSLLSPWGAINADFKKKEIQEELSHLRDIVVHYWNGEQLQFDMTVRLFQNSIIRRINPSEVKNFRGLNFEMEIINNQLRPLLWAKLFYGFALLVFIASVFFKQVFLQYLSLFFGFLGFILHAWAIITLSLIMARPPLAGFYEIFSFIGFISVLGGFIFIGFKKRSTRLLVSIEKFKKQ